MEQLPRNKHIHYSHDESVLKFPQARMSVLQLGLSLVYYSGVLVIVRRCAYVNNAVDVSHSIWVTGYGETFKFWNR